MKQQTETSHKTSRAVETRQLPHVDSLKAQKAGKRFACRLLIAEGSHEFGLAATLHRVERDDKINDCIALMDMCRWRRSIDKLT